MVRSIELQLSPPSLDVSEMSQNSFYLYNHYYQYKTENFWLYHFTSNNRIFQVYPNESLRSIIIGQADMEPAGTENWLPHNPIITFHVSPKTDIHALRGGSFVHLGQLGVRRGTYNLTINPCLTLFGNHRARGLNFIKLCLAKKTQEKREQKHPWHRIRSVARIRMKSPSDFSRERRLSQILFLDVQKKKASNLRKKIYVIMRRRITLKMFKKIRPSGIHKISFSR